MSIWVTGDIHGSIDIKKLSHRRWPEGRMLTSEDQLIICGDFGMPWDGSNEEKYWLGWLCDRPWTTLFVDGNHECFPYLAELPESERWGGRVQVYHDYPGIVHLMHGEVYDIDGARIFAMGGAASHDKQWRTPGWDWFPEEMPRVVELCAAEGRLETVGWQVDYVVSHCCATRIIKVRFLLRADTTCLSRVVRYGCCLLVVRAIVLVDRRSLRFCPSGVMPARREGSSRRYRVCQ